MSESFPYADLVILALIAGFILLRLRSVLGSDSDNSTLFKRETLKSMPQEPIIQLDEKSLKPKILIENDPYAASITDPAVAKIIADIKAADPQFSASYFLSGAKAAFEMVFEAFAKGDKAALKSLLADAVYQHFAIEIDNRSAQENKTETTLVSVIARDITQASLDKTTSRLSVHFASEQIVLLRNPKGEIVEGNPSELQHMENEWVFERDVSSKNPNWKIIET